MRSETDDLKFYSGDVRNEDPEDEIYSDPKAYVTLNALLFPGVLTEKARVKEGRKLNPAFLKDIGKTVSIIQNISSTMKPLQNDVTVYRVERLADYEVFRTLSYMPSFISCSDNGFLSSYTDKYDLVFMEVHVHEGTMCVHLEDMLEDYMKRDEHELLLAPYCVVECTEVPVPEKYRDIRDGRGNPVRVYVHVDVYPAVPLQIETGETADEETVNACVHLYECLNTGKPCCDSDVMAYMKFKRVLYKMICTK